MKKGIFLIIILVILIVTAVGIVIILNNNNSSDNNEIEGKIEDVNGKFYTDRISIKLFDYTNFNTETGQYNIIKDVEVTEGKTIKNIVNMCNAKDMEIPMHEKVNLLIMNEIELDFNNGIVLYLESERDNYGYIIGHPEFSGLVYLPDGLLDYVKEIL